MKLSVIAGRLMSETPIHKTADRAINAFFQSEALAVLNAFPLRIMTRLFFQTLEIDIFHRGVSLQDQKEK